MQHRAHRAQQLAFLDRQPAIVRDAAHQPSMSTFLAKGRRCTSRASASRKRRRPAFDVAKRGPVLRQHHGDARFDRHARPARGRWRPAARAPRTARGWLPTPATASPLPCCAPASSSSQQIGRQQQRQAALEHVDARVRQRQLRATTSRNFCRSASVRRRSAGNSCCTAGSRSAGASESASALLREHLRGDFSDRRRCSRMPRWRALHVLHLGSPAAPGPARARDRRSRRTRAAAPGCLARQRSA